MKTYDEVTEHILSTAKSRRRKQRQLQYAASVSMVCVACMMGLGVYMKLEKPPAIPMEEETFTSAVSESASASPGEFPTTFTAEQPIFPAESGSMTDLPEPSAAFPGFGEGLPFPPGELPPLVPLPPASESALPSTGAPQTDPPETTAVHYTTVVERETTAFTGYTEYAETDRVTLPPFTDNPIDETDIPELTDSPVYSTNLPVTESPLTTTEVVGHTDEFTTTRMLGETTASTEHQDAFTETLSPSELLELLPPFAPSGKMELKLWQINILIDLYFQNELPYYWAEFVEKYILMN